MDIWRAKNSEPVWTSFENPTGGRAMGARENHGAKGAPSAPFAAGEVKVLCDLQGEGFVRRIWLTLKEREPEVLQDIRIRMWWDGCETPAVDAPVSDFFCMGHGHMLPFENACFASPEGRSYLCYIPMPFRKGAKIALANESGVAISQLFYDVNLTREAVPEDALYFHTQYHKQTISDNCPLEEEVVLADAPGRGKILGFNVAVEVNTVYEGAWWGEGEIKAYFGGDKEPTLVGTGTEDYIGTAWGQGEYISRYAGCTLLRPDAASFYRFHIPDPIHFADGCKVTLQYIGGCVRAKAVALEAKGAPMIMTSVFIDGVNHLLYKTDWSWDELAEDAFAIFFRRDGFATVAYLYLEKP